LSFAFLLFSLLLTTSAFSQDTANITGIVTDKNGGTISGVTISLVNAATGANYSATTGDDGAYLIPKVPPGPGYELTASKDGFQKTTISNLYLPIAITTTRNVTLEIGSVTQTVEVHAEGSVTLNTTDSTIGNNFDIRAVSNLPNEFRGSPANLLRLQPAVVSADSTNNLDDNGASRNGSVAGARADQNNITVDGIDASDFGVGKAFTQVAPSPVDTIQEFRTEVANPLADMGRGSGANTVITTKSGTNEWHGNLREYHRNTATEANDFFNNKNGVDRPALIRNQFGGQVGGPIKKDKLFFFFDYDARRDASATPVEAVVPLNQVRAGGISYINNGPGCTAQATLISAPQCITTLTPAQVAALDPCSNAATAPGSCTTNGQPGGTPVTPGFNPGILALFNSRYPQANDLSGGDGINTGGFRFNAPNPDTVNTYTTRVDWDLTSRQKLFTRFTFYNVHAIVNGLPSIQFPGDPITNPAIETDRSWVLGHTFIINSNLVNQFIYGESRAQFDGIASLTGSANPGGDPGVYAGLNWLYPTGITAPYARPGGSSSLNPVPTFRDDLTWTHGRHSFTFGGLWRPIRTRSQLDNNYIFTNQGLLTINALDPNLRPANILQPNTAPDPNGIAVSNFDGAYAAFLGIGALQFNVFNYDKTAAVTPAGDGARRDYRYYETEVYAQDSWKIRSDLTITYGLRYGYDSVPYETVGNEATANVQLNQLLQTRIANGLAGISGDNAAPILTYTLAGKANGSSAPSLFGSSPHDFSPRVGIAWNPSFHDNLLGSVFGDRKTVLRAGFAQIYDHTALSAINFVEDQSNYIFNSSTTFATGGTPEQYLAGSPRFTTAGAALVDQPAPPFSPSVQPNVGPNFGCAPPVNICGTTFNSFGNYVIDQNYKTPYSYAISAGVQRELPAGFQLEVDYVGRLAHRLSALADGGQLVDFTDPASKQTLVGAISALENDARQHLDPSAVPTQQFLENQMGSQLAAFGGCAALGASVGVANCTQYVYATNQVPLAQGNTFNVVKVLAQAPAPGIPTLLPTNVGVTPQFVSNYYFANKSWSNYQGLLVILRKRLSHNVQMDFNYTFSHSLDNFSGVANSVGNPFNNAQSVLCDSINLATCKGDSEFDVKHQIIVDAIWDLPFGHGQTFGRNSSRWVNELIGGWQVSGVYSFRTGFAFPIQDGVSTVSFGSTGYPIFNGNTAALAVNPHTDPNLGGGIQLFADPAAALASFSAPTGTETGARDELRGPHFSNVDLALSKNFPLWGEKYRLQFRTEAYNAFNHTNFALPSNININGSNFGLITSTSSVSGDQSARVLQFALRFEF
jgi:hypothetical protein